MKNLIILLTLFTLVFQSCNNDDDDPIAEDVIISPYAGMWKGTYDGDDSGTWWAEVSESGDPIRGGSYSNNAGLSQGNKSGSISADGLWLNVANNGTEGRSQIEGNKVTGTWYNPNNNLSGTSEGSKE